MGHPVEAIKQPRTDEKPLWDVWFGLSGYPAVLVANQLKLFELLAEKPITLDEVCRAKKLAKRPAEALLSVCTSLGFVVLREGRYSLTPVSEDYLLPWSPTYFGWFFDAWAPIYSVWSPESLLKAVMTDKPQGPFGDPNNAFALWHADQALNFTRAIHSASMAAGLAWPKHVDLSSHRVMLDVGGGSGAHSIGAVTACPGLHAIVLDQQMICDIARCFSEQHGLSGRISTRTADFFKDPFPPADVHFYGMIFHDWPPEACRSLARKSFESLPTDGRIIIHEMLVNDDRTGPFPSPHLMWICSRRCQGSNIPGASCVACSPKLDSRMSNQSRRSATGASSLAAKRPDKDRIKNHITRVSLGEGHECKSCPGQKKQGPRPPADS
jgi:hypothetical protein